MKTLLLLFAALCFAAPALAQPVVSLSASGGYVPGTLTHRPGVGLDAAVNIRWSRVLVGLHAAELTYTRLNVGRPVTDPATGETRTERGTEPDFDYGVGLDVSYVQPVHSAVALFGGAGMRLRSDDAPEPHSSSSGLTTEVPHLQAGLLLGQTDAVHAVVRVALRHRVERVQIGVAVPLHFGR